VRSTTGSRCAAGGGFVARTTARARSRASNGVATNLSTCEFKVTANLQEQAASQRKFETMLRDGGAAYALVEPGRSALDLPDCVAVRADPYKKGRRDLYEGNLWSAVRDGKLTGKTGYGYQLTPNELEMTFLGPYTSWSDGSGSSMGCGDSSSISYGRDSVELGQTHYLSLARCKAARERERQAWLPEPIEEPGAEPQLAGTATPSIGGC
jgi:hypothetical protein